MLRVTTPDLERGARGPKIDPSSGAVAATLAAQGWALDGVPSEGQEVEVLPNANLSTGGTAMDLTGKIAPEAAALAVAARMAAFARCSIYSACRAPAARLAPWP